MKTAIILSGHGDFPLGIHDAIEKIAGPQEDFSAIPFDTTQDQDVLKEAFKEAISAFEDADTVVVFCDLLGGTPFKTAVEFQMSDDRIRVVPGVNLPTLIEFALQRSFSEDIDDLLEQSIETGQAGLLNFKISFDDDDMEVEDN